MALDRRAVGVEFGESPFPGCVLGVNEQPTLLGIEVRLFLGDPEIHVDGCRVGVDAERSERSVAFVRPHHLQRQSAHDPREPLAEFARETQHQLRAEPVVEVGTEIARVEVVPDRAFAAELA